MASESPSEPVYCASPEAIAAATAAWYEHMGGIPNAQALAGSLIAAHHPNLGRDRSVCLRDLVEWLYGQPTTLSTDAFTEAANALLQEFGG